jgi:hypothetical protein
MESSEAPTAPGGSGADAPPPWQSPADAHAAAGDDAFAERPEIFVGVAFAGGLALAGVLRWLNR